MLQLENMDALMSDIEHYIKTSFVKLAPPVLLFHNYDHTYNVVKAVTKIADAEKLTTEEKEVLLIAAWFHDLGYCYSYQNHEAYSIVLALDFLSKRSLKILTRSWITECIMVTKMPQAPKTVLEKVICDADLYHLSSTSFFSQTELLRQEKEKMLCLKITKEEWQQQNINFLMSHEYHTNYGRQILEIGKQQNLTELLL